MKFGLTEEQFQILKTLVIDPLHEKGIEVFVFGSRVTNQQHSYSDIDILYRLPHGKSLPKGFISLLKEKIEDSRFPFTVDLVDESELAESYKENILRTMKKI